MDPQDLSKATTTSSSSSNDEEKSLAAEREEVSIVLSSKRNRFLKTYRRQNPDFWRLGFLSLNCIPQAFDIDVFHEYMKKNITTKFDLEFDATISDAYKARLGAIIDEILGTKTLDLKPPLINFIGINHEKHYKLVSVFHRN